MSQYPKFLEPLNPCNVPVRRCPVSRQKASHRFLIVKLWALGDILMATPLLTALREFYPEAHITWLITPDNRQALDAHPYVDEVIVWDRDFWRDLLSKRWKNMLHLRRFLGIPWLVQVVRVLQDLRRLKIDTLITMHAEIWPSLVFAAAPSRAIGLLRLWPPPKLFRWHRRLYATIYTVPQFPPHSTDRYLLPLRALGVGAVPDKQMVLGYTTQDATAVDTLLSSSVCSLNLPLVVIAPMTTSPSKNWPVERYVELGDALAQRGCQIVLIGTGEQVPIIETIAAGMDTRPLVAAGTLGIRGIAALIARADILISSDTGPMHAAAAVGTRYVALFGPTHVERLAPLSGTGVTLRHSVPCGPCDRAHCMTEGDDHHLCMRLITVEEVVSAADSLLSEARRAG